METRQLRYFQAVAEAGHMTRAAAALGIQQPPLSQQIKALEQRLGLPLFHRHARGVTLTDGGRLLLEESRRILSDLAALEQRMERVAQGEQGALKLAFTSSAAAHRFTPELLRTCRRQYPGIRLEIGESNAAEVTEGVLNARLHCGLLRAPVSRPAGLTFELLLNEPMVVALPVDHRLAARSPRQRLKPLALAELREEALILVRRPGAPGMYGNLLALCEEQGFRPRVAAEVERMVTNLSLVAAGVGVSVVPASMQGLHPDEVVYRPLAGGTRLDAPLTLVYRTADCIGLTENFVALTRAIAAKHRKAGAQSAAAARKP